MDADGRSGKPQQGSGGSDSQDTVHYPKVVLVTGACRFLGGYLTARLAQDPLINHVIAVDAIAPSKDLLRRMGRALMRYLKEERLELSPPRFLETAIALHDLIAARPPSKTREELSPELKSVIRLISAD